MVKLKDLIHHLNDKLQVSKIEDFCPNGLQLEGSDEPVKKVVTAVSTSIKTIEEAIKEKSQVLLVHHGIFWNKDPYVIQGVKKKKIKMLLDHGITLLAYHLPLDCHPTLGNNWKAALDLGWENLQPFGPAQGEISLGVTGTFPEKRVEDFQKELEDHYNHKAHVALGGKKMISSAALISGGAHREIHRAVQLGVDCFITGSFDEPIWDVAHEEKIHFFACGHYNTETVGPKAIGAYLAKNFNLEHKFIEVPNPF